MQTIDEAKEHCRFVAQGIVDAVAAGEIVGFQFDEETSAALREFFETLYNS